MDDRTTTLLTVVVLLAGVLAFLGLSVYPFQYGLVESLAVAGGVVALGLVEFVLDRSSF
jgi:hypothetical protein